MPESTVLRKILLRASELGMRLFRNQTGKYLLQDGRWLSSGLCVGSSDLIGWTPLVITQEMVGRTVAVFTAVETKAENKKATDRQTDFLAAVAAAGGLASVARSVEDVERMIGDQDARIAVGDGQAARSRGRRQHPLGHVESSGAS